METKNPSKILVVDDDPRLRDLLRRYLGEQGFNVYVAENAPSMNKLWVRERFDLLVLDLMLPGEDGLSICRRLRGSNDRTPIIMLTAKGEDVDRIVGLEMGADDYLPKPFFVEELVARIKAVMQRKMPEQVQQIAVNHLTLDVVSHKVQWFGVTAVLSQREFSLLAFLMRSPGHIFSRQQILKHVWEINFDPETNVVDVCVRRIKRKLERGSGGHTSPIESVRGVGYRLRVEA